MFQQEENFQNLSPGGNSNNSLIAGTGTFVELPPPTNPTHASQGVVDL